MITGCGGKSTTCSLRETTFATLSKKAADESLAGLEFASGIPGNVGGAIYMNAGAYKSDMGYITQEVTVLTQIR